MSADRVTPLPPDSLPKQPVYLLLPEDTARRALALLVAYANSDVPDDVSLECAQVCGELRGRLREAQP